MNVAQNIMYVVIIQHASIHPDHLDVNVKVVLLVHHQELDAKHLVKMSSVDHMLTVNQIIPRPTVFVKMAGPIIQVISQQVVLILMNVIMYMVHPVDVV